MSDWSRICDLHHSSRQCQILNPLSEVRDQACVLMDTSQIHFHWGMRGTPRGLGFSLYSDVFLFASSIFYSLFTFFFFFLLFRAALMAYGSSQARGRIRAAATGLHHKPQQHSIQAESATYTMAHGNVRSPTHWAKTGIKPTSLWILVRFVSTEPWQEFPFFTIFLSLFGLRIFSFHDISSIDFLTETSQIPNPLRQFFILLY